MSKDFGVWGRLPNKLELMVVDSPVPFFVLDPREENCIHTYFRLEHGVRNRVPKLIELPADAWDILIAEFSDDKFVTNFQVYNHILERRTRLIMRRPSSINKLELLIHKQLAHLVPPVLFL